MSQLVGGVDRQSESAILCREMSIQEERKELQLGEVPPDEGAARKVSVS